MSYAETMAALVAELLDDTPVRVEYTVRRGTRLEQRAATRHDPGLLRQLGSTAGRATTALIREDIVVQDGDRMIRTGHTLRRVPVSAHSIPGATTPSGSPGWDADGAMSPMTGGGAFESSAPTTDALLLEDQIASEIAMVHGYARQALGHASTRATVGGRLRELVGLVGQLDDDQAVWVVGYTRSWVTQCRTSLGYDARQIELARWRCTECAGRIRTRADELSQVWCAGLGVVSGPALPGEEMPVRYDKCGATWSKGQWVDFMARQAATPARDLSGCA